MSGGSARSWRASPSRPSPNARRGRAHWLRPGRWSRPGGCPPSARAGFRRRPRGPRESSGSPLAPSLRFRCAILARRSRGDGSVTTAATLPRSHLFATPCARRIRPTPTRCPIGAPASQLRPRLRPDRGSSAVELRRIWRERPTLAQLLTNRTRPNRPKRPTFVLLLIHRRRRNRRRRPTLAPLLTNRAPLNRPQHRLGLGAHGRGPDGWGRCRPAGVTRRPAGGRSSDSCRTRRGPFRRSGRT